MISLKKQLVLVAATAILGACGGGGGGGGGSAGTPVTSLDTINLASIATAATPWEITPTSKTVTVTVNGQPKAGLQVLVYRYTEETLGDGTVIQVPGDLVGSGTTSDGTDGATGTVALDLIADTSTSVLIEVLDGPVKLEYQGKSYRIINADQLGTLAF